MGLYFSKLINGNDDIVKQCITIYRITHPDFPQLNYIAIIK